MERNIKIRGKERPLTKNKGITELNQTTNTLNLTLLLYPLYFISRLEQ